MPERLIEGIRIYYQQRGQGEPLVLLHSGLGTGGDFATVISDLARHYQVFSPDRPGYGRSSHVGSFDGSFFVDQANWLARFLEAMGLTPASLWGWSDGAVVALWLAILRPELIRAVVVEAGHLYGRKADRDFLEQHTAPLGLPAEERQRLARQHGEDHWQALSRKWGQMWLNLYQFGGELYQGRLHQVRAPTCILHADNDRHIPVQEVQDLQAQIPGAHLQIFPGGGHDLHVGPAREQCLAAALAFLGRVLYSEETQP